MNNNNNKGYGHCVSVMCITVSTRKEECLHSLWVRGWQGGVRTDFMEKGYKKDDQYSDVSRCHVPYRALQ